MRAQKINETSLRRVGNWDKKTGGVNPFEKSCDFYNLFCVHTYSNREAKVDKGVQLFF